MFWDMVGTGGGIFLFLLAMVIIGNLWFHFVESVLGRIKRLFSRRKDPPAWHPLPPDKEEQNDV